MTEYNFSPDAYEAHTRKQNQIPNWLANTNPQPLRGPFVPATPAVHTVARKYGAKYYSRPSLACAICRSRKIHCDSKLRLCLEDAERQRQLKDAEKRRQLEESRRAVLVKIQKLEDELPFYARQEQKPGRRKYDQRRLQQQFAPAPQDQRLQKPVNVRINGVEYERVINRTRKRQTKGSSVFYSNESSDVPYLIIIHDTYLVAEYRLLALGDKSLPSQVFLRLSQAVLAAHNEGRVLGPDLNIGNMKWDISRGVDGLPIVTFKNLPPPTTPTGPPPLPPKWPVPELMSGPPGSTKESDIYSTPLALFQILERIEQITAMSKEHMSLSSGTTEIEYHTVASQTGAPTPPAEPKIPSVIEENKPLLRIVKKCLSPRPSRRPTAEALCDMLLRLCKSSVLGRALKDVGKSFFSALKRITPY